MEIPENAENGCDSNNSPQQKRGRKRKHYEMEAQRVEIEELSHNGLKLPVEVLEKIFSYVHPFNEIQRSKKVCKLINGVCTNVLRSAYHALEITLLRDVTELRRRFSEDISLIHQKPPKGFPYRYKGKKRLLQLSKSILQLETILSSLALVKANMWVFTSTGIRSDYNGKFLDIYHRVRQKIMETRHCEPGTTPAMTQMVRKCRRAAANYIQHVTRWLKKKRFSAKDRRMVDGLGGVSLLHTMLCCVDSYHSVPHLTRHGSGGENSDEAEMVTLSTIISLRKCWLGIEPTEEYLKQTAQRRAEDVMQAIKELVWNSNHENYLFDWQNRTKLITPNHEILCLMSDDPIHLRSGIAKVDIIPDYKLKRTFNIIDTLNNERIVYYGHSSRVTGVCVDDFIPPSLREPPACEQVLFDNRVVFLPLNFSDGVVDVKIEVTCNEDLLPRYFLAKATSDPKRRAPACTMPSYYLQIASHENESRSNSRLYNFFGCRMEAMQNQEMEMDAMEESLPKEPKQSRQLQLADDQSNQIDGDRSYDPPAKRQRKR